MVQVVVAEVSVSVGDLRRDPEKALAAGEGNPVAITRYGKVTHYAVPAALYEQWHGIVERTTALRAV